MWKPQYYQNLRTCLEKKKNSFIYLFCKSRNHRQMSCPTIQAGAPSLAASCSISLIHQRCAFTLFKSAHRHNSITLTTPPPTPPFVCTFFYDLCLGGLRVQLYSSIYMFYFRDVKEKKFLTPNYKKFSPMQYGLCLKCCSD